MNPNETHLEGLVPHEMIAIRAHQLWIARGCPEGQAELDWFAARSELERELPLSVALQHAADGAPRKRAA